MFIKMWQPQSNPHSNISYYCNELLTQFSLQTQTIINCTALELPSFSLKKFKKGDFSYAKILTNIWNSMSIWFELLIVN